MFTVTAGRALWLWCVDIVCRYCVDSVDVHGAGAGVRLCCAPAAGRPAAAPLPRSTELTLLPVTRTRAAHSRV